MPPGSFDDGAGWVAVPGYLSESDIAAVTDVCSELLKLPAHERRPRDKPHAGTRHLASLDERSQFIDSLLKRRAIIDVVSEILGSEFHRDEVSYRCPQPSFGGQKLHADDVPKLTSAAASVATAIVALTDFTKTNGATRVIPGSHRRIDLQRHSGSLDNHPDATYLTGAAGTAFVFSGHLLHSGTKNRSTEERPALQIVWRR